MASYVGSIAELMQRSGQLRAQRLIDAANLQAQGEQQRAALAADSLQRRVQANASMVGNIVNTASGTIGDILKYTQDAKRTKLLEQDYADRHAAAGRQAEAFDLAKRQAYQSQRAMMPQAAGGGPGDSDFGGAPNDPGYGSAPRPAGVPLNTPGLTPGMLPTMPAPDGSSPGAPAPQTPRFGSEPGPTPYSNPNRLDPNRMVAPTREQMITGQPTVELQQKLRSMFYEIDDRAEKARKATKEAKDAQADALGITAYGLTRHGVENGQINPRAWQAALQEAAGAGVTPEAIDKLNEQFQSDPASVLPMLDTLIDRSPTARGLREKDSNDKPMPVTAGTDLYDPKTQKWIKNPTPKEQPDYTIGETRYDGMTNKPLVTNERELRLKEATAAAARVTAAAKNGETAANKADTMAMMDGIESGKLPPLLPGRASPQYVALSAEAARRGFDLAGAVTDWVATQKYVATRNNAQQVRLNQNIDALPELLDSVESLAKEWKAGQFPALNKLEMEAAINGLYGDKAAVIARKLKTQIADVVADLGGVYMGGNSPTDHALKLAETALAGEWSEKVLVEMVGQAKRNVRTRQRSINNVGVQGASEDNPYYHQPAGEAQPLTTPPPAPPGWRYEKNAQGGWTAVQAR